LISYTLVKAGRGEVPRRQFADLDPYCAVCPSLHLSRCRI